VGEAAAGGEALARRKEAAVAVGEALARREEAAGAVGEALARPEEAAGGEAPARREEVTEKPGEFRGPPVVAPLVSEAAAGQEVSRIWSNPDKNIGAVAK
jgi:hypothetical protein